MELEKGLLRQIFRFCNVADHAQTEGVDASFMQRIKIREGVVVACLGSG
jgi:hypothetical protein